MRPPVVALEDLGAEGGVRVELDGVVAGADEVVDYVGGVGGGVVGMGAEPLAAGDALHTGGRSGDLAVGARVVGKVDRGGVVVGVGGVVRGRCGRVAVGGRRRGVIGVVILGTEQYMCEGERE